MNFEELQSNWQSADHAAPLNLSTELLLKEVRRNQRYFEVLLLRRDLLEIVAAAVLTGLFLRDAIWKEDWSSYVAALAASEVGTFMVSDRWLQRRRRPKSDDSLQSGIQAALAQVNHQIWLLRNVFWWGLLPIVIGWGSVVGNRAWQKRDVAPTSYYIGQAVYAIVSLLIFYGIYWLNQRGVKKELEPRRDELDAMLASLNQ